MKLSRYVAKLIGLIAVLYRHLLMRENEAAFAKLYAFDNKIERQHHILDIERDRLGDLHRLRNEQADIAARTHAVNADAFDKVKDL